MTQQHPADLISVAFMAPKLSPKWEEYLGQSMLHMARAEGHKAVLPHLAPNGGGESAYVSRAKPFHETQKYQQALTRAAQRKAILTHAALTPRTRSQYLAALDYPTSTLDNHLKFLNHHGYLSRSTTLTLNRCGTQRVKVALWKITEKGRNAIENTPEQLKDTKE